LNIADIKDILNAKLLVCKEIEREILCACGSDLMSDVLAYVKEQAVLLTGLTNPHVIRTAEMLDVWAIVFVRGKIPAKEILEMASERNIAVMTTNYTLYEACGRLYKTGLPPCGIV
jgi:predicted transcriptional regulator